MRNPSVDVTVIHGTPASIPVLRALVSDFCELVELNFEDTPDVRLCTTEAVTNVIRHAYADGPGALRLRADYQYGALEVVVRDEGCGHTLASQDPGLGMGLALIDKLCAHSTVTEHDEGGTEVVMRFECGPSGSQANPSVARHS